MARIQDCRQGCGAKVTVQLEAASGKYKPYDVDKIDPETGEYMLHDCPKSQYNLNKGKFYKPQQTSSTAAPAGYAVVAPSQKYPRNTTTQGGETLDLKRTRVIGQENFQAINELRDEVKALREFLSNKVILDSNRNEGQLNQIYNVIAPFLSTQGVVASELAKQDRQDILDTAMVNHSKIADENIARKNNVTKFVDESKERYDLDDRIPDNQNELIGAINDDNNENIIAEGDD